MQALDLIARQRDTTAVHDRPALNGLEVPQALIDIFSYVTFTSTPPEILKGSALVKDHVLGIVMAFTGKDGVNGVMQGVVNRVGSLTLAKHG